MRVLRKLSQGWQMLKMYFILVGFEITCGTHCSFLPPPQFAQRGVAATLASVLVAGISAPAIAETW